MSTKKIAIITFLIQKEIAVVGASRSKRKYGNLAFTLFKKNNYVVYPVNPNTAFINNVTCFPNIESLPDTVTAAFIITPKNQTANSVNEAISKGIKHIWIQTTSETLKAIEIAENNKINLIKHECIFMHIESKRIPHNVHRYFKKLIGTLAKQNLKIIF